MTIACRLELIRNMGTYRQILFQLVISTRKRGRTLIHGPDARLHAYMASILIEKKCHPYIVNGVEDHIHILTDIHPDQALSSLVKDIKLASTDFIKRVRLFPDFEGWSDGYGAFTYHFNLKDILYAYVRNQRVHHKRISYEDEVVGLFEEHGIKYERRFIP